MTTSEPLFERLPAVIEELILSFRQQLLLNKTKGEYINYSTRNLKRLLKKNTQKQVIISKKVGEVVKMRTEDIGKTTWNKNDQMIIVPFHLENYVKTHYPEIEI